MNEPSDPNVPAEVSSSISSESLGAGLTAWLDKSPAPLGAEVGLGLDGSLKLPTGADRYQLGDEIARGGMGVVCRAIDTVLGREVAVKFLLAKCGPTSGAALRFADEARIAGRLQHPAIPPVHDLGTLSDGRAFLAMKLIQGKTLEAMLQERPDIAADRGRFVAVFEQVCQALACAHSHHVIHRDLKPANIMVGSFGEVQVMDWGLAKDLTSRDGAAETGVWVAPSASSGAPVVAFDLVQIADHRVGHDSADRTQAGEVMGTPAFMPPEQARGEVDGIDRRSDVFSLGGILCVILTGKPPYLGRSLESLQKAAAADLTDSWTRLDACGAEAELIALCKRCLNPNPKDRPADGGEVAALVADYRAGVEQRLRRAERERAAAEAKAVEQRKKRRVQLALAAAIGLLVCAGAGFAWWQDRQARERRFEEDRLTEERLAEQERNGQQIEALLDRCETAITKDDDAAAALFALGEAEKRAANLGADHLKERLARCRVAAKVLVDLDRIDDLRWSVEEGQFQGEKRAIKEWPTAFARIGVVVGQTPPAQAAAAVNGSLAHNRLLAALDLWLFFADPVERAHLAAILAAADADPFRDAVRTSVQKSDWQAVKALAAQDEALAQPARFAAALGSIASVPLARRVAVLEAAARARPRDYGVLMTAGSLYGFGNSGTASERVAWYRGAVVLRPASAVAHNRLGLALSDKKDWDGAIAEYRAAIKIDPKFVFARGNLTYSLIGKKDLDGVIAECRAALQIDPNFAVAYNNLGVALKAKGDLDEAIAQFRAAIEHDRKFLLARMNLGNALKDKGDLDAAIAEYRAAIQFNPKNVNAHFTLGNALKDKGNLGGASAEYRAAIQFNPKHVNAHFNLGNILKTKGDLDGASAEFRAAIQFNPKHVKAHESLANALYAKKDWDGAIAQFRVALQLDPKLTLAHVNLAAALKDKGDLDAAIAAYRAALQLSPKDAAAHANLGKTLKAKGDLDGAVAEFRAALQLDPKQVSTYESLGNALYEKGDMEGAVAAFKGLIQLQPKSALAHDFVAFILLNAGDAVGALPFAVKAVELNPKFAQHHFNLGRARMGVGQLDEAIAEFKEALRINPKHASLNSLPRAERMRELLPRLPEVLAGRAEPKNPAETCEFAALCAQPFQKRFVEAVRLYEKAFNADAKLAADLIKAHRYNAARYAALAARGDGALAPADPPERASLRQKALAWLRADLLLRNKQAASSSPAVRKAAAVAMTIWLKNADLAQTRPDWPQGGLTPAEQADWGALWADVRATLAEAQKPHELR